MARHGNRSGRRCRASFDRRRLPPPGTRRVRRAGSSSAAPTQPVFVVGRILLPKSRLAAARIEQGARGAARRRAASRPNAVQSRAGSRAPAGRALGGGLGGPLVGSSLEPHGHLGLRRLRYPARSGQPDRPRPAGSGRRSRGGLRASSEFRNFARQCALEAPCLFLKFVGRANHLLVCRLLCQLLGFPFSLIIIYRERRFLLERSAKGIDQSKLLHEALVFRLCVVSAESCSKCTCFLFFSSCIFIHLQQNAITGGLCSQLSTNATYSATMASSSLPVSGCLA